eukprot:4119528-Pleurochrysis_carterae.AAC.1
MSVIEGLGCLQHWNDEVLEKGNRDDKRFRDMSIKGGSSAANKKKLKQKRSRRVENSDPEMSSESEEIEVTRSNNIGVIENAMQLHTARKVVLQRSKHEVSMLKSKKRRARSKQTKREERVLLKREPLGSLVVPRPP